MKSNQVTQLIAMIVGIASSANAAWTTEPLTTAEYQITVSTKQLDVSEWNFTYTVRNINQGMGIGTQTGLDGFGIELPSTARIVDMVMPAPYSPGDRWAAALSGGELMWWGANDPSVYETGSTATFSVTLDNVTVGTTSSQLLTYWRAWTPPAAYYQPDNFSLHNYTGFSTDLIGPASGPLPGSGPVLPAGVPAIAFPSPYGPLAVPESPTWFAGIAAFTLVLWRSPRARPCRTVR